MGFFDDITGQTKRPARLPAVPTPAGDALREPLLSGLSGEGFDPAGEAVSKRARTLALRSSFVSGERDFKRTLDRTLQRGDIAPREVATAERRRSLNLGLEDIRRSGAEIPFQQQLQAQDIGLGVAADELQTNLRIARARSTSKIRQIFSPDFDEGLVRGIAGGVGAAVGSGAFEPRAQGEVAQAGPSSFRNPPGIIESQEPSTNFFQRFSKAFSFRP